jgi:hypothetical protein
MAPQRYPIGPGLLTIGATGTEIDWSCQITSAQVEWESDAEDDEKVLCGDTIPGARTYTATLSGTAHQDLGAPAAESMVAFSWANKGTTQPFVFVPNDTLTSQITGSVVIDPLTVGGDIGTNGTSDFEWACVGEPDLGTYTPAAGDQARGTGRKRERVGA